MAIDFQPDNGSQIDFQPIESDQSFAPESQTFDSPEPNKIDNLKNKMSVSPTGMLDKGRNDIMGGVLNSLLQTAKMIPDMADMVPQDMQKYLPYKSGERPAEKMDAYKSMGTEDKDFYTPGGALQTLGELMVPMPALAKGFKKGKEIIQSFPTRKYLANYILKPYDKLENKAVKGFEEVSKGVNERGITTVPVKSKFIEGLRRFFPKTEEANALLNKAKSGDYNALRDVQSQMYTSAKKNARSALETERMKGAEAFEKREKINSLISSHLKNTGHHDLNALLDESRADYKKLHDIYYHPKMSKSIQNMVDKESRKIPRNLGNILREDSMPMQALKDFHPGLENALKKHQLFNNALKYGIPTSLGALGAAGFEGAKHYL